MEKEIIENLILQLDRQKKIQARDELLDVYILLYSPEFEQCSLFEIIERNEPLH